MCGSWLLALAHFRSSVSVLGSNRVFLLVTESSGHPVPQFAALESSWSVVTGSECHRVLRSSGSAFAAPESSLSVSRSLAVLRCVFVYLRSSAKVCVCLPRSSVSNSLVLTQSVIVY
jgi:hypothetical protein